MRIKTKALSKLKCLWLMTGFSCNNNCVCCNRDLQRYDAPTNLLISRMREGHRKGYLGIDFMGGEVSIRPDFLTLVYCAKKLGFKGIGLTTNGRKFSNENFTRKAVKAGLNEIKFSLYSHIRNVHDKITRVAGSYQECLEGIKNILPYPDIFVSIKTVILKHNKDHLLKIGRFVHELKIKEWILLEFLAPFEIRNYRKLVVSYKELSTCFSTIEKICPLFKRITFYDFPFCLFKSSLIENRNIFFDNSINIFKKFSGSSFLTNVPKRVILLNQDNPAFYIFNRVKIPLCARCRYLPKCPGMNKLYFNIFGSNEMKYLSKFFKKSKTSANSLYFPQNKTKG